MQLAKFFLLLFYLFFSIQVVGQKNESPEDLGKIVFEALVKKDSVLFEKAKATKSELSFAFHKMMKKLNKEVDEKEIEKVYSMYSEKIVLSFIETIKDGENEGIIWSEIAYSKTVFNERSDSDPELVEIGNTHLEIEYNGKTYIVKIGDSIKLNGNWTIEDTIHWKGEKA